MGYNEPKLFYCCRQCSESGWRRQLVLVERAQRNVEARRRTIIRPKASSAQHSMKTLFVGFFGCVACLYTNIVAHGGVSAKGNPDMESAPKHEDNYFLDLDPGKRDELMRGLLDVKLGNTYSTIIKRLGPPTYDQRLVKKDGTFHSRVLSYYVKKWRKNIVNEKYDQLVRLEFSQSNVLVGIKSNIAK